MFYILALFTTLNILCITQSIHFSPQNRRGVCHWVNLVRSYDITKSMTEAYTKNFTSCQPKLIGDSNILS